MSRVVAAIVCAAAVSACGSDDPAAGCVPTESAAGAFTVDCTHDPDPPQAGAATLNLTIEDAAGVAVEGASLTVEPWMTAHDHGVNDAPVVSEDGGGSYVAEWDYTMPGYWEVTVEVVAADATDTAVFGFDVQ